MRSPFDQAIELTQPLYTFAALHLIAEKHNDIWKNRYTSVIYGREHDLRSIPPKPVPKEEEEAGNTFLLLRQRLERSEAEAFVKDAINGRADIGARTVVYDIEPAITGFRPAHSTENLAEVSMWNSSGWSREHIGKDKEIAGYTLSPSTAWRIDEGLGFLRKVIWLPIPLREHPEKLGDLDEFWPTPIAFEIRRANGTHSVAISYDILRPADDRVRIHGAVIRNDLIYGHVCFEGRGPHPLPVEPEAIDMSLCVDGIPLDARANRFITGVSMRITTDTGPHGTYVVPEAGARPEMKYLLSRTEHRQQVIGNKAGTSVRHTAWTIGRIFRSTLRSADSERFYDPATMPNAIKGTFDDLQQLGNGERGPHVLIADPYALDERSLYAIGTVAVRLGGVSSIDIVTGFKSGEGSASGKKGLLGTMWAAVKAWALFNSKEAQMKKRQEMERKAFETADRVAKQLGVRFRFYSAERLHDRFLVIGERIWHVGPSFNKIGEQISALVEMTDERVKWQVRDTLGRFTAGELLKEASP
jgi:hypothetical protein